MTHIEKASEYDQEMSESQTYFNIMDESFQDYSWIQDFEADFPKKVSLKMLNQADNNSFFWYIITVYLKTINHLNLKYDYLEGILQVLKFEFLKFRILEILNFHPCIINYDRYWKSKRV